MTIKEYATSRGVSYETCRRQVAAAKKKALKGHLTYQGKQTILDDFAIEYLDQHRQPRNVVVAASSEETQRELERLHNQVHQLQAELLKKQEELLNAKDRELKLVEDKTRTDTLLMLADKEHEELDNTKQELSEVKQELSKYQRTLFGLYKKID